MPEVVVLAIPTVTHGTIVRWYPSEGAALRGNEMASASRYGVFANSALREVAMAAYDAHERLVADADADMSHLATHHRRTGPVLEQITPAEVSRGE